MTRLNGWLVASLLLGTMAYAIAEEITLTTYYPSPRGVYDQLRTAGDVQIGTIEPSGLDPVPRLHIVQGDAAPALRIDDESPVGTIYDSTPFAVDQDGNVGIGIAGPKAKLDVVGGIKVGDMSTGSPQAGTLRWNSGKLQVHNGTDWVDFVLSGASGLTGGGTLNVLSKWTGAGQLGDSLIVDDGTNLGISVAPSAPYRLRVNGAVSATDFDASNRMNTPEVHLTGLGVFLSRLYTSDTQIAGRLGIGIAPSSKLTVDNPTGEAIWGSTLGGTGVRATASNGTALTASATTGNAIVGNVTGSGTAVWGSAVSGTAGRFDGNVTMSLDLFLNRNLTVQTGNAWKPGGGSWAAISDARLKSNIQPLSGALERLLQLHGVEFEWKDPASQGNLTGPQIGFIGQDVERAFPAWVSETPQGYKSVSIRGFEALTVEALRELEEENHMLRQRVEALEERLEHSR